VSRARIAGSQKGYHMKRMAYLAAAVLILLGASAATAQSLGDYARSARKTKPQSPSTTRHYDNDNLPKDETVSVVGPEAGRNASNAQAPGSASAQTDGAKASTNDQKAQAADRQKSAEDLQKKIDEQQQKIDALNHELDLAQREYRLRAAAMYSDAGNRLRNAAMWDKEDSQYKQELAEKQKAIEAARQELENAQEKARKAGLKQKEQE
jgi:hypothetical protein